MTIAPVGITDVKLRADSKKQHVYVFNDNLCACDFELLVFVIEI